MRDPAGPPYDVAVVGLGPVGTTLAHLLCAEGLRVVGLDRRTEPLSHPRAIGLDHESMRVFQAIGVADALLPFTETYRASEYRAADGALLRRIVAAPEPFPLAWPPNLTFVQPELERLLLESARRLPGFDLRLGAEVQGAAADESGVTLDVCGTTAGSLSGVVSRYLVACDGAASPIRQSLSIGLDDLAFDEPWLVVDVRLTGEVALPEVNIQVCDPRRPITYVRGPGSLRRWEIMMLPGETPADVLAEERIWGFLKPWLDPGQATIWRAATYRFHALVAQRWRQGRILLAGDACHQTPPFLAQGLNQGIRDAANLAWKLAAVVRGNAGEVLLDTYGQERRPNVRAVIAITKDLGRIIGERDERLAGERDARMTAAVAAGEGLIVRQDLLPPVSEGFLDGPGGLYRTGETCPQPWIETIEGPRRMDDIIGRGLRVLLGPTVDPTPAVERMAHRMGAKVARIGTPPLSRPEGEFCETLIERDGVLSTWMARRSCDAVIVRPDHVVFGVASGTEALGALMQRLLDRGWRWCPGLARCDAPR